MNIQLTANRQSSSRLGKGARLARPTAIMVSMSAASMVVGYLMNLLVAAEIGARWQKDAYDVAWAIPRGLMVLSGLALVDGLVTDIFSKGHVTQPAEQDRLFSTLLNTVLVIGVVVALAVLPFTGALVQLIGPGLDPSALVLARRLALLACPLLILIGLLSLLTSVLLASQKYGYSEAIRIVPKAAVAISVVALADRMNVWALVLGTIVGYAAAVLVSFIAVFRAGVHYRVTFDWRSPLLRQGAKSAFPLFSATALSEFSLLSLLSVLSHGRPGTVACYNYALAMMAPLAALVAIPISRAIAPTISRMVASGNTGGVTRAVRAAIDFSLIATMGLVGLGIADGPLIIDTLLGRGRFTVEDADLAGRFLGIMLVGAVGMTLRMVAIRVLIAYHRVWYIFVAVILVSLVRFGVAFGASKALSEFAAPLAYSAAHIVDAGTCLIGVLAVVRTPPTRRLGAYFVKAMFSSAVVFTAGLIPAYLHPCGLQASLPERLMHFGVAAAFLLLGSVCATLLLRGSRDFKVFGTCN